MKTIIRQHLIKLYSKLTSSIRNSKVSSKASISYNVKFYNSSIEDYSYISNNCNIFHTTIGKYTSIGLGCNIGGGEHPLDWVSSSPAFQDNKTFHIGFFEHHFEPYKLTRIGNDVFIAPQTIIKSGVTIGDGAVIGAGAVITKDVGPYEIWAGNPARMIRLRFSEENVAKMTGIKWWEWPFEKIKEYSKYFNDPARFLEIAQQTEIQK